MTETVPDEKMAVLTETIPSGERLAERRTIVYETRIDPTVIKMTAEKLKLQLFARFRFLKPKPEEIELISIDKYYEPYMLISGKYAIDYYRKCAYTIQIEKEVIEVILLNQKFEPCHTADSPMRDRNTIALEGEERLKKEAKASLVLDRNGQEVPLERLPSAPSERNPKKILAAFGTEEITQDADLDTIRSRIVQRPKYISRLVNEIFEVDERVVIYTPRFRALYRNMMSNEERIIEFDGVTAARIRQSKHGENSIPPPPPPPP
ncbi:MAG: hypothetical protein ABSC91_12150 [Candidatus Bathyarchaeia archaeon]